LAPTGVMHETAAASTRLRSMHCFCRVMHGWLESGETGQDTGKAVPTAARPCTFPPQLLLTRPDPSGEGPHAHTCIVPLHSRLHPGTGRLQLHRRRNTTIAGVPAQASPPTPIVLRTCQKVRFPGSRMAMRARLETWLSPGTGTTRRSTTNAERRANQIINVTINQPVFPTLRVSQTI
jgi:hypothetical protein